MKKASRKSYSAKSESIPKIDEPAFTYRSARSAINTSRYSEMDMLVLIKKGIPKKTLDKTMQMMDVTLDEMSAILHVSERTIRRFDDNAILNTEQSERILELNNLYLFGQEVLGGLDSFKVWMNTPILALGNKRPKAFLDTSIGIQMLTNILSRIEYGVYS